MNVGGGPWRVLREHHDRDIGGLQEPRRRVEREPHLGAVGALGGEDGRIGVLSVLESDRSAGRRVHPVEESVDLRQRHPDLHLLEGGRNQLLLPLRLGVRSKLPNEVWNGREHEESGHGHQHNPDAAALPPTLLTLGFQAVR